MRVIDAVETSHPSPREIEPPKTDHRKHDHGQSAEEPIGKVVEPIKSHGNAHLSTAVQSIIAEYLFVHALIASPP